MRINKDSDTPEVLSQLSSSHCLHQFCFLFGRGVAVSLFSTASSLSLPVVVIALLQKYSINLTNFEKNIYPVIPYGLLVVCRSWLVSNGLVNRLNGKEDRPILPLTHEDARSDHSRVILALLANLSSITNVMLVVMFSAKEAHIAVQCSLFIVSGGLNYLLELYTDVVDSFRKHVEYCDDKGVHVKPLFQQPLVRSVYSYSDKVAVCIRELLPVFRGFVRSRAFLEVMKGYVKERNIALQIVCYLLSVLIYCASAYSCGFELIQLRDNIESMGKTFVVKNYLSHSSSYLLQFLGRVCSGQVFMDVAQIGLSQLMSFYGVLLFSAIGSMSLIKTIMTIYLSSNDRSAVVNGHEGLVMQYYLGCEKALSLAPMIDITVMGLSVILGCLSTYSQKSTLSQYSTLLGVYSSARVHQACDLPSEGDVHCNENENESIGAVAMPMT